MRGLLRLDLDNSPFLFLVFGEFLVGVGKESREANMELDLAASFFFLRKAPNSCGPDGSALRSLSLPRADHSLFQENHEGGKDGEREEGARLPDEQ